MTRKPLIGTLLFAAVAAACSSSGTATSAPTTAASTPAPVATTAATTAPATSVPATAPLTVAAAVFEPKAGANPSVTGTAALADVNGKTTVVITVMSSSTEKMAASIQAGTCDSLNPEIAFRLTEVASGASTTTVDVDLATLLATPYAINISVMGSETESSITCGEIKAP